MISGPQESRQPEQETLDEKNIMPIPAGKGAQVEAEVLASSGGPADEWATPSRVQIPGYDVLEQLGKGGMGIVYKARQLALNRIVALKMILRAEHVGPAERQRFQIEAEAAARLQHPNIVQVFEFGTHDGLPYLTLEYCPGGSLAQRLKGTSWPIREAVQLVETLANAVQAAHAARVVHRDLNPANVLLTATDQPKITDFGLAKKLGEPSRTQSGAIVGTPSYMSPEQASGKAKEVGPPADIYALGAILYELLTGRPPFKAATALETILQVASDEPMPLRRLRPELPLDLETICLKCLEKEPVARYTSAESLAGDLRHFLAGEPIRVRRVSSWEKAVKWARRRPAVVMAAAASMGALLSLLVLIAVLWRNTGNVPIIALPTVPDEVKPPDLLVNPRVPLTKKEDGDEAANVVELSQEARDSVKRATVYLRVKLSDGTQASGSGFFGCKDAHNIIITNAHVVGMLAPKSARPLSIEVIVNSGEANEWKTNARVLGVDHEWDLAVLDIGTPPQPVPEPLTIKSAGGLHELDVVFAFGFPFGESLGKGITIRSALVSALRKDKQSGVLKRVEVNCGMEAGSGGAPVVDRSGAVVGVIANIISGQQINIVIPGERVLAILDGRISDLAVHQPYFTSDNKVAVPVVMDMIDPRDLVKEVGLEVWTGNKPADAHLENRLATTQRAQAQADDSPHVYYKLKYIAPQGKGEIVLPELPPGKVYWQQPKWIDSKGETHWAYANPMQLLSPPVYRKPANLVLRYSQGSKRSLDLTIENIFKVSNDVNADSIRIKRAARLSETVAATESSGTVLNLCYQSPPSHDLIMQDGKSIPNSKLEPIKKDLARLIISDVHLDGLGNITRQAVEDRSLRQLSQTNPKQVEQMKIFHETIQRALESLSLSFPAGGTVQPLETWKAERSLPIDVPGKTEMGTLDVTYTYLGMRKRDGREEAVISMDGLVHSKVDALGGKANSQVLLDQLQARENFASNGISGKANGQILVDLANGQTIFAEVTTKLQLRAQLNKSGEQPREILVLATVNVRMQRK